jgi:hypothetical protein
MTELPPFPDQDTLPSAYRLKMLELEERREAESHRLAKQLARRLPKANHQRKTP